MARRAASRFKVDVGYMYYTGSGVDRDAGVAASWYRAAADQEDPKGLLNLGVLYANGDGVGEDLRQALETMIEMTRESSRSGS